MQLKIPFTKDKYLGKKFFFGLGLVLGAVLFFALGAGFVLYRFNYLPSAENSGQVDIKQVLVKGIVNPEAPKDLETADFSIFWDAWAAVQEHYLNRGKLDYQKMVYGAVKGMLNSLDDPYTVFFEPKEKQEFEEEISGKFEGVGMEIGIRQDVLTVIAPLEGTPAQKAGIKPGDKIVEIDGASTQGIGLDQAVAKIRGPKGTKVVLTIIRDGIETSQKIEVVRDTINIPSVKLEKIGDDIAHLKVYNFYGPVSFEFKKAILEILLTGRDKIILDLRNNPGGYFDYAVQLASWFLEPGSVVVKQDDGNGAYVCSICRASGLALLKDKKVVILVNGGSASASEILAGALRDNKGIKLIGEQTFGKGSVQELYPLSRDSSIKITTAKWLTPNEHDISKVGLEPDIVVEAPDEFGKDPQLDKAIEIIRQE
ncbi:MAG: S41 family peptidase [Patescibacteria group bacterium]